MCLAGWCDAWHAAMLHGSLLVSGAGAVGELVMCFCVDAEQEPETLFVSSNRRHLVACLGVVQRNEWILEQQYSGDEAFKLAENMLTVLLSFSSSVSFPLLCSTFLFLHSSSSFFPLLFSPSPFSFLSSSPFSFPPPSFLLLLLLSTVLPSFFSLFFPHCFCLLLSSFLLFFPP